MRCWGGFAKVEPFIPWAPKTRTLCGGFAFIVLGRQRVHVFCPDALEGSRFSSSGAEGFTVLVVVRRRVHIFSHVGGPGTRGFKFSDRVQVFSQASGKKIRCSKSAVSLRGFIKKKRHFWSLAAITGFGGPAVPEGSTFQWSVPRAAKKSEPFDDMGSKL